MEQETQVLPEKDQEAHHAKRPTHVNKNWLAMAGPVIRRGVLAGSTFSEIVFPADRGRIVLRGGGCVLYLSYPMPVRHYWLLGRVRTASLFVEGGHATR